MVLCKGNNKHLYPLSILLGPRFVSLEGKEGTQGSHSFGTQNGHQVMALRAASATVQSLRYLGDEKTICRTEHCNVKVVAVGVLD